MNLLYFSGAWVVVVIVVCILLAGIASGWLCGVAYDIVFGGLKRWLDRKWMDRKQ